MYEIESIFLNHPVFWLVVYNIHNICKYVKFRGKVQFTEWYKHIL